MPKILGHLVFFCAERVSSDVYPIKTKSMYKTAMTLYDQTNVRFKTLLRWPTC